MSELLTKTAIGELIGRLLADGRRVAGPQCVNADDPNRREDLIQYRWLEKPEQLKLDGFIRPSNSAKEYVFPKHEPLYGYTFKGKQIELTPIETPIVEQVVFAARPCDAAAFKILDAVFNWDFKDENYNRRRELTTVVALACTESDNFCFCTSVGSGPTDARGADAILLPIDGDKFEVRCLTDKGRKLFDGATQQASETAKEYAGPAVKFDLEAVKKFLDGGYDQPEWQQFTLQCLGCGACAYSCPTCHCFDIVDEGNAKGGIRARNWDACQFSMFTQHASGHNPRAVQPQRQRQRIQHKFHIYPQKFGELLCTGCGNCSRNCPVNMGVLPVLKAISDKK